jgi:hypothetical protein
MDLQLILRVLWRFRLLVGVGIVLAVVLATLSYIKLPTDGKIEYRQAESWESLSQIFVTSSGFPWGSTGNAPDVEVPPEQQKIDPNELDPIHLTGLAALYTRLATSDQVIKLIEQDGPLNGTLAAYPVSSDDAGDGDPLPMVTFAATAETPVAAQTLAQRHVDAFVNFIESEQRRAGIPRKERVVVDIARHPQAATLMVGRKKTRPMVVFVAVMIAVIGLAFALENIRPRVKVLPGAADAGGRGRERDASAVEAIARDPEAVARKPARRPTRARRSA